MNNLSNIRVNKLINGQELYWIDPTATVTEASEMLVEKNVGALAVIEEGRLIGVVSERDIVQRCVGQPDRVPETTKVRQIMSAPPITIHRNMSIGVAAVMMMENGIRHLPVMQRDKCIGMISIRRVVGEYRAQLERQMVGFAAE